MARCARNDLGPFATEGFEVFPERIDVLCRVIVDAEPGLLRLGDDAIVHIRDVHHVSDFESFELQIAANDVGSDGAAEVADVTVVPDSWTAVVEAGFAVFQRAKFFDAAGECVTEFKH